MCNFAPFCNMKKLQLRQYQDSDQDAVWRLHINGLKQTDSFIDDRKYDKDILTIKDIYINNGGDFLVALLNKKIIGIGGLRKFDDKTAEIKRMRVNIKYQQKGVGTIILERLIKRAKELDYKKVIIDATENQKVAQHLYEKRGFKEYKRG